MRAMLTVRFTCACLLNPGQNGRASAHTRGFGHVESKKTGCARQVAVKTVIICDDNDDDDASEVLNIEMRMLRSAG